MALLTITIPSITLQFDSEDDALNLEGRKEEIRRAIQSINDVLRRQPYGLDAQLWIADESIESNEFTVEYQDDDSDHVDNDDYPAFDANQLFPM